MVSFLVPYLDVLFDFGWDKLVSVAMLCMERWRTSVAPPTTSSPSAQWFTGLVVV